jgi:hypothetical protein
MRFQGFLYLQSKDTEYMIKKFLEDNKEAIAEKVHDAWWEEKKKQGFHSPLECSDAGSGEKFLLVCDKCHADMYPYDDLPEHVKDYDRVTVEAVINAVSNIGDQRPFNKTLNTCNAHAARKVVRDIEIMGDGDQFQLLCKASSKNEGWMKSTKAMEIEGVGCVVQVTTQQGEHVAEALQFVPGVKIIGDGDNCRALIKI